MEFSVSQRDFCCQFCASEQLQLAACCCSQEKQATLKEELAWHVEQRSRDRGAAAAIKAPGAEQERGSTRPASPGEPTTLSCV